MQVENIQIRFGFGALDISQTKASWILLDWKIKVLDRPMYAEELRVKTWGRYFQKAYTYRDYEIYNSKGELCVIATSKWALIDIEKRNVLKLTDEIKNKYKPEEKSVFNEKVLDKMKIPTEFQREITYTVGRKDIDINNHMHNTYYLSLAYEVLPEDVYENRPYDNFRITYKKEIQLGDTITCKYTYENNEHIIVIMTPEKEVINAIIKLSK